MSSLQHQQFVLSYYYGTNAWTLSIISLADMRDPLVFVLQRSAIPIVLAITSYYFITIIDTIFCDLLVDDKNMHIFSSDFILVFLPLGYLYSENIC